MTAGAPAGPSCLSLKRAGGNALVSLVGSGLSRELQAEALAAAKAAGLRASAAGRGARYLTLKTPAGSGESLLRALHELFFSGQGAHH